MPDSLHGHEPAIKPTTETNPRLGISPAPRLTNEATLMRACEIHPADGNAEEPLPHGVRELPAGRERLPARPGQIAGRQQQVVSGSRTGRVCLIGQLGRVLIIPVL